MKSKPRVLQIASQYHETKERELAGYSWCAAVKQMSHRICKHYKQKGPSTSFYKTQRTKAAG